MEFINNIKWYHVLILCLICIIGFLIFTRTNYASNSCKNAVNNYEGFDQEHKNKHTQHTPRDMDELVLYYAMWCGYSKSFIPEWEKFETYAKNNFPQIKVSKIRCEDGNETTCMQKGVDGYPTVILYTKNGKEIKFGNERTMDGLIKFIQQNNK